MTEPTRHHERGFPPTRVDGQPPENIGPDHWLFRMFWKQTWVGVEHHHRRPDNGRPCAGYFLFARPEAQEWANAYVAGGTPARWTVLSYDPLTVSPSLQCTACPMHGFIHQGRWVQG